MTQKKSSKSAKELSETDAVAERHSPDKTQLYNEETEGATHILTVPGFPPYMEKRRTS